jgi:outer membrane protein TolC
MTEPSSFGRAPWASTVATVALLSACASFSPDSGFAPVERAAQERLGKQLVWERSDADRDLIGRRVGELLARPLSIDDAVQLALLNNRGLQAALHELGISDAERVQAGRLRNPGFSFKRTTKGDETEWERELTFSLASLIALPFLRDVQSARFAQVQGEAALKVLSLAADTRKAWVQAVAAEESVRYSAQVMQAAEASAELARRMAQVGNFNRLTQLREQSFYADAAHVHARATQAQRAARERLLRLLGLWGEQAAALQLPQRLPEPPPAPQDLPDIERLALEQRLDVRGARLATEQTAHQLGLTRTTRFVNVLNLGLVHNSFNDGPTERGWEVSIEIPLFDWGEARVARAESLYMQAVQRTAEVAIEARSEVREAYGAYRTAWDVVRHHRDEIVPLRQRIAEENLLRYNGMLIGVFELLADARAQVASVNAAIDALRDFWIAQADLDMALIGKPTLAAAAAVSANVPAGPAGVAH